MQNIGDIADSQTRAQLFHRTFVKAEVVGIVRTGPSTGPQLALVDNTTISGRRGVVGSTAMKS